MFLVCWALVSCRGRVESTTEDAKVGTPRGTAVKRPGGAAEAGMEHCKSEMEGRARLGGMLGFGRD